MQMEAFFGGTTTSTGVLEDRSGRPTKRFNVEGHGRSLSDGSFELTQRIEFESELPTTRTWVVRRIDKHRLAGTLSDASGPVHAEEFGNLLHVEYPMVKPFLGHMEQWLYLQPDGYTVVNEATISLLGVTAARLSERISRSNP